ncbi:MAG: radical SAM protein, partial [Acidobacteria bacterium]
MSAVLLGQSYFLRFDPKLWRAMQPYAPLGTLIAASCLRQRGFDVALFDAMLARDESEWEAAVERHRPRYAVLFEDNFNYLSKMCLLRMRQAAFTMIRSARRHGATVLVCGSDATDHAAAYLEAGAQLVIHGEGEATLGEALAALDGGGDLARVAGLTIAPQLAGGDEALRTPPRPVLRDLDALPFPAWDLVDVERYRRLWLARHGYFSMNLVATRGCPYHCNWCAKPIWGQTYHMRSPENVADELAELRARYRPDHLWFADDILGLKRGWMAEFAAAVAARGARTPFKCLSRADLLGRRGEVESLARAGCDIVWIGAESGSQKILDAMEKGTTVEQIRAAAQKVHEAGMRIGFFLQFGYPGETREDLELTRALVRDCRPDEIGMSVSYPLPGTPFYRRVEAELGAKRNWVDSEDLDMMYRGPFPTAFYRQLHRVVSKEFRAQLAADELRRALSRPQRLRPAHLRRAAALAYHHLTLPWARRQLERRARLPHRGLGPLAGAMSP